MLSGKFKALKALDVNLVIRSVGQRQRNVQPLREIDAGDIQPVIKKIVCLD